MNEEEYYDSDPDFENFDEFGDAFLSDETTSDKINIIQLPVFDHDIDEFVAGYFDTLKKCRNTEDALNVLYEMVGQLRLLTILERDCSELQNKAHELEEVMETLKFR